MTGNGATTSGELRAHNRVRLLRAVHDGGATRTRSQLTRDLDLARGTASVLVGGLTEDRLLHEEPAPEHGRGRPTMIPGPHPHGPVVLAADVREDSWELAACELGGRVTVLAVRPHDGTPEGAFLPLGAAIATHGARYGDRVVGVGVAVAGPVRPDGRVDVSHLRWRAIDVPALLSQGASTSRDLPSDNPAGLPAHQGPAAHGSPGPSDRPAHANLATTDPGPADQRAPGLSGDPTDRPARAEHPGSAECGGMRASGLRFPRQNARDPADRPAHATENPVAADRGGVGAAGFGLAGQAGGDPLSVFGEMIVPGVRVGNDTALAGLAEARRGRLRGVGIGLHLHVDFDLGGVLVVGGRPLGGASGAGAEFGHMALGGPGAGEPALCMCGARGCWGMDVGANALLRHLGLEYGGGRGRGQAEEILARAEDGDEGAGEAVLAVVGALGRGIAALVNAHDPEVVTLSGLGADLLDRAGAELRAAGEPWLMTIRRESPPPIVASALRWRGSLLGAMEAVFDAFLTPAGLASWTGSDTPGNKV
ncbi:ROK family protein [Nonomuraea sp. NPDC048826]|uniref:ROK family protein n=1 Tax=Nonomuraea sp. NPDC048826 TaxID=3364347 RepID=UPI0037180333